MSPIVFTLEALGTIQVQREFLRFSEHAQASEELWRQIGKDLRRIEEVQFLTEGAHGGEKWDPLKEDTVKQKKSKGEEPWILRASGALFRSLTAQEAEGSIFEVTKTFLRYGTALPYAGFHQGGAPGANIPVRKIVHLTPSERSGIAKQVQRYILTGEVAPLL